MRSELNYTVSVSNKADTNMLAIIYANDQTLSEYNKKLYQTPDLFFQVGL